MITKKEKQELKKPKLFKSGIALFIEALYLL